MNKVKSSLAKLGAVAIIATGTLAFTPSTSQQTEYGLQADGTWISLENMVEGPNPGEYQCDISEPTTCKAHFDEQPAPGTPAPPNADLGRFVIN